MKKFNFQKVTLSADEKVRFHQRMTVQMTGYLWIPLCLLLLFQLYNMGYVLYYTDFALRSEASKVYFIMYLAMFSVLAATGIQLRFFASDWNWRLTLRSIWALTAFILLWALCITVYDQRTSDNISVYTQMTLSIAVLIYMPPKVFLPLFLSTQALFMLFLPLFQTGEFGDNYGIYVNSIWSTLIAVFVCYYHYYTALRSFKGDLIIEENTSLLMENNRKLDDLAKRTSLRKPTTGVTLPLTLRSFVKSRTNRRWNST